MGLGYLDTQLKIQVHFLMLIATSIIFSAGVMIFIWDFFRTGPKLADEPNAPGEPLVEHA
jgi:nitric oxide reductase subunit B